MKTALEIFEEKKETYIRLYNEESNYRFLIQQYIRENDFEKVAKFREKRKSIKTEMESIYLEIIRIYDDEPISTINLNLKREILIFKAKLGINLVEFTLNQSIKKQVQVLLLKQEIAFQNNQFDESNKISNEVNKLISITKKPLDYFL